MKIHTLGYIRAPSDALCQDILLSHTQGCIQYHCEPLRGSVAFITVTEVMPINDPTSMENKKGDDD